MFGSCHQARWRIELPADLPKSIDDASILQHHGFRVFLHSPFMPCPLTTPTDGRPSKSASHPQLDRPSVRAPGMAGGTNCTRRPIHGGNGSPTAFKGCPVARRGLPEADQKRLKVVDMTCVTWGSDRACHPPWHSSGTWSWVSSLALSFDLSRARIDARGVRSR